MDFVIATGAASSDRLSGEGPLAALLRGGLQPAGPAHAAGAAGHRSAAAADP